MRNAIIGLVVLLLVVFGLLYFIQNEKATSEQPDTSQNITEPQEEQTGYTPLTRQDINTIVSADTYFHAEPELLYSLVLPNEIDVSSPQAGITRYRYVGPDSEADSEITDGYTITIYASESNETSVSNVAASNLDSSNATVLEEPSEVKLANQTAIRYETESALGSNPITQYAFLPNNSHEYIVSVNISPTNNTQYESETREIINSLSFYTAGTEQTLRQRQIPIAMLDYGAVGNDYIRESSGVERGCDRVVIIEHTLAEYTTTPLNDSLSQLFSYESETVAGWQNFIASQKDTLSFEQATIASSTAQIYLSGELGPMGGVCDNPRAAIQIEETALAYDTVDAVEIYLNGELTELTAGGQGN